MQKDNKFLEKEIQSVKDKIKSHKDLLESESSEEMRKLIREEVSKLEEVKKNLELSVDQMNPDNYQNNTARDDKTDIDKNVVILEVRAGTGGDEAGLFAAELCEMYKRYAEKRKWKIDEISSSKNSMGGFKTASIYIKGKGVYDALKNESGVHRVQRVPVTESGGRIHTSTATVAILPELRKIELEIKPEEIKEEFFRSGGHGGQNVNKVSTAVRITHIPTGEVVECQQERTQLKNREKAMSILRSRLYEMMRKQNVESISNLRSDQVGTGERSEKIRTYNFPQDRVTDHRINQSWHNIQNIMLGGIDSILEALRGINEDNINSNNTALPIDG